MAALDAITKELAFSVEEHQQRVQRVRDGMRERDIEVLLVHHPPSVYYLSGYQSFSMYIGECVVVPQEGAVTLMVPLMEMGGALLHSWLEQPVGIPLGEDPTRVLTRILADQRLERARVGVEQTSAALSPQRFAALQAALPSADLVDASGLIETVKATKSAQEIAYLRRSAKITDLGMRAAIEVAAEGKMDNDLAATAYQAMIGAGSEYMSLAPIVTTGRRSGILHSTHKRIRIGRGDPVAMEMGACYQRYTAPIMRTVSIGKPAEGVQRLANACLTALNNVLATMRPGITADEVATAGWEGIDLAGSGLVFHGTFGYAVGASFPPSWGDGTAAIRRGIQTRLHPGMVFHLPIALRALGQYGMMFSETALITEDGCEALTTVERQLFIK